MVAKSGSLWIVLTLALGMVAFDVLALLGAHRGHTWAGIVCQGLASMFAIVAGIELGGGGSETR